VLESLIQRDPDTLEWEPFIATSWEIEDFSEEWQAYVDKRLAVPITEAEIKK
jgi:ABC-type transport system substrate-binding protein